MDRHLPEASAAAQLPAFFFGIVLGGGAAWAAGRVHRAGFAGQLAAARSPRWRADALLLASSVTYGVAGYLPGVVLAGVVSVPEAGPGFLWPSYLLLGACMVVLCTSIGHLAGKVWSSRFVPPLVVAVCMFGMLFTRQLFEFYVLSAPVQVEISALALIARGAVTLLAATLAVVMPIAGQTIGWGPDPRAVISAGTVAAVAGLVLVPFGGPLRVDRAAPDDPLCSDGSPRVCVWPESRKYLGPIGEMAARLAALPPDLIKVPPPSTRRVCAGRNP